MSARKGPDSVDLAAANELIQEKLGVSLSELLAAASVAREMPTFAEYVPVLVTRTSAGSLRTWIIYWRVIVAEWGARRIDEPTLAEIKEFAELVRLRSAQRPGSKGGHGAMANFIDAMNNLYRHAVDDEYFTVSSSPAARLTKSQQRPSPRHALSSSQVDQLNASAAEGGLDPELDTLILRLLTETACRRAGSLTLRRCDLDRVSCTVRLREKGVVRIQPVSPTLMTALIAHTDERNPDGRDDEQLLRHRRGTPLNRNYFDDLWRRMGIRLPWVAKLGVTAHWLRYTTLTWVERNFGYAVAAAYAGHASRGSRRGNTHTYVKATLEEVATVLSALTGEPHPLAVQSRAEKRMFVNYPAQFPVVPEIDSEGAPLGVLEGVVQRCVSKSGYIHIRDQRYWISRHFWKVVVDVHVFTGRYLVQLPDGTVRIFPRPPGAGVEVPGRPSMRVGIAGERAPTC